MKVAVLDLGTNTFNLLIAELQSGKFEIIKNAKESVKIGKGGIHKNTILPDAINRGINALQKHFQLIEFYKVDKIVAIGTSALRTADNAFEFVRLVKEEFKIDIEIISGEREAELIYAGIKASLGNIDDNFLILDIGGGSNEFIIGNKHEIFWKKSFPLGMARINELFKPSDPISDKEIELMKKYFDKELQSLIIEASKFQIKYLIGAEGAFETFYNCVYDSGKQTLDKAQFLEIEKFEDFYKTLVKTNILERSQIKGIEPFRLEMVVPAIIFVDFVVKKINIQKILVSGFSLKEGVVSEILKK